MRNDRQSPAKEIESARRYDVEYLVYREETFGKSGRCTSNVRREPDLRSREPMCQFLGGWRLDQNTVANKL